MKRNLILSDQQFVSMVECLGYKPILEEEAYYRCGSDGSCEPFVSYTMHVKLPGNYPLFPKGVCFARVYEN